jgi:hypothetical protein
MKTTIFRIHEDDLMDVCKSFFNRRFTDHQLSRRGMWFGTESQRLRLPNPISFSSLYNMMSRREAHDILPADWSRMVSSKRDEGARSQSKRDMAGWRVALEAGETYSTIWALGPKSAQLKIRDAHLESVDRALVSLEADLHQERGINPWKENQRPIFATFFSGADSQQSPSLNTTVLIPRRHLSYDRSISEISESKLEKAHKILDSAYTESLRSLFGDEKMIDLPRISLNVVAPGDRKQGARLLSTQLFGEWRKIAHESGINAIEATTRELKALGFEERKLQEQISLPRLQAPSTTNTNGHQPQSNRNSHTH